MLKQAKSTFSNLPTPTSISFMWNMGFLMGMTLILQIITGLFLSMIYTAHIALSFKSMIMIMQDTNMGWITRMMHANGASLFFILLYLHIARGMYFSSPMNKKGVWFSGMLILMTLMATAFLGYVLPWGQMSFWGATVITGVLSAIPMIGKDLTTWIWGGPAVYQPTLNRFFSLHFLLPMLIALLSMIHMFILHSKGSSNPLGTQTNLDKMKFNPKFSVKDCVPLIIIMILTMILMSNMPNIFADVENYNPANPMVAPAHIQPEWYFLFAYAILRSIPTKLGGVIALGMSILILSVMLTKKNKSMKFMIMKKLLFWLLMSSITILTFIGAKPVEAPYEGIGQIYTILYFTFMLLL